MTNDPLEARYTDFMQQEQWLYDELNDVLDRAATEACLTRCQCVGILTDIMLTRLGRPPVAIPKRKSADNADD